MAWSKVWGVLLVAALTACGGGGGGGGDSGGGGGGTTTAGGGGTGTNPTPVPPPPPAVVSAIDTAVASGDPAALSDPLPIIVQAYNRALSLSKAQAALTQSLQRGVSSEYTPGSSSQFILPGNPELAQPLIVGDGGQMLASISIAEGGRSAGYGTNVLDQFRSGTLTHAPAFGRLLSWLVSGNADTALPASMDVSIAGVSVGNTISGLGKAGITAKDAGCDALADSACAARVSLVIVGSGVAVDATLTARTRTLLKSGKPVLYLHTGGWGDSQSGRQMLNAMSLDLGGYGGNYWSGDKVAAGRSDAANARVSDQFDDILPLLSRLATDKLRSDYDWSKCGDSSCGDVPRFNDEVITPTELIRTQLNTFNGNVRPLFATPDTTLLRLLTLWADVTRKQIVYPLDKQKNPAAFQQAMIADAWVSYVRSVGSRQNDLGTFMSANGAKLPVSASDETVSVTLSDTGGFTAIGRMAMPGQPLQITVLDAGTATTALRINTQRGSSTKIGNAYTRPRILASPSMPLAAGTTLPVVTPYGGLLQLQYSGATPGQVVKLKLRGVAKQPFLDTTVSSDRTAFVSALTSTTSDWVEIKMAGMEAHARTSMLRDVINGSDYKGDMNKYLDEMINLFFDDAYGFAGFARAGKTLPASITTYCGTKGWDCSDATLHRGPGTQHINIDVYAQCGAGCSGNPYDQTWGLTPRGWGESHELGHNLQLGVLSIYTGAATGEVSNQIFPLHKMWRMYRELGVDLNNTRVAYRNAFDLIVAAKATSTPVDSAYQALWADTSYAAQNGIRMAFYTQWVHYWQERTGNATQAWDIYTLLYLHSRLFSQTDWATNKDKLGYSQYTTRPSVDGNDNMLIALSWITHRNQRPTFDLWGIKYSAAAASQVDSYGFAQESAFFYANTSTNNYSTVRKVSMTAASPAWPF
ncbi:immunomodulating metalloprotease [Jeongeupia sp. HS-3]|uniref:ImpA family metalloprotease n=1 Tax=Jeongeupia sp. HS-3 TaxID=1009682 RepID=UPI0018A36084|nr:ImpA family metalloprotease [Jeongeupia sp. HS-3]BCL75979.1 immunomodulating metalloprotease [Jeongeupia sp. HS-3]